MSGGPARCRGGDADRSWSAGRAAAFERAEPLLRALGRPFHVGGAGAGQAAKLCNNLIAGVTMAALAEACAIAEREGIDAALLYELLTTSTGDSRVLRTRYPLPGAAPAHPSSNGYAPLFMLDLMAKDLALALELEPRTRRSAPLRSPRTRRRRQAGLGALDYSAVYLTRRHAGRAHDGRGAPVRRASARARSPRCRSRASARAGAQREIVAASLLEADRRGVHTHGLVRLPSYCADARSGRVVVDAVPRVERDDGPVAMIDGGGGFGAVTGAAGMDEAIARAERHGVGFVTTRGGNHFGAAAFYALRAVERGMIGIAATSTPAVMAPWGGAEARIGNNPLSIAAPTPEGSRPFVLDLAQSAVSRGRIKLAELAGCQEKSPGLYQGKQYQG